LSPERRQWANRISEQFVGDKRTLRRACESVCSSAIEEDDVKSVTLTPEIEARIRPWLETGRYADADAVMLTALEALEEQEPARFLTLRELILAGHNSGPGEKLTEELWDRLEREAEETYHRGEKPSPRVCP